MGTNSYEGGNGFIGGQPMYWDMNPDGTTNIFPGGMPGGQPHDHIVVNDAGGVEYMRVDGEVINDYRDYHG